ncbi:hypothetical protein NQ315_003538 [Exocentrus adspersus]|uniref:RNA-directed DNA polymerase n=1 Tax=Exocentrus adspersus TaxID=1586481 RepID=A0AAV8VCT1_9CUCU|nr:hypothetical protein NQ315_003538 [Exocentrus adspersus]
MDPRAFDNGNGSFLRHGAQRGAMDASLLQRAFEEGYLRCQERQQAQSNRLIYTGFRNSLEASWTSRTSTPDQFLRAPYEPQMQRQQTVSHDRVESHGPVTSRVDTHVPAVHYEVSRKSPVPTPRRSRMQQPLGEVMQRQHENAGESPMWRTLDQTGYNEPVEAYPRPFLRPRRPTNPTDDFEEQSRRHYESVIAEEERQREMQAVRHEDSMRFLRELDTAALYEPPPVLEQRIRYADNIDGFAEDLSCHNEPRQPQMASTDRREAPRRSQPATERDNKFEQGVLTCLETLLDKNLKLQKVHYPVKTDLEYSGRDDEDPAVFMKKMDDFFDEQDVKKEEKKIKVLKAALKGAAKQWAEVQPPQITYAEFREKLLQRYNSTQLLCDITRKLYGEEQGPSEKVYAFLIKKVALFNRLAPTTPQPVRVKILTELLRACYSRAVRAEKPSNTDEMIVCCENAERDIAREAKEKSKPATKTTTTDSSKQASATQKKRTDNSDNKKSWVPAPGRESDFGDRTPGNWRKSSNDTAPRQHRDGQHPRDAQAPRRPHVNAVTTREADGRRTPSAERRRPATSGRQGAAGPGGGDTRVEYARRDRPHQRGNNQRAEETQGNEEFGALVRQEANVPGTLLPGEGGKEVRVPVQVHVPVVPVPVPAAEDSQQPEAPSNVTTNPIKTNKRRTESIFATKDIAREDAGIPSTESNPPLLRRHSVVADEINDLEEPTEMSSNDIAPLEDGEMIRIHVLTADEEAICPRLSLRMSDGEVQALVDTGAGVNLIRTDLAAGMQRVEDKLVTLQLASIGATTITSGTAEVQYTIDEMPLTTRMLLVDELHEECILGRPWLRDQRVVMDFDQRVIYFGKDRRRCAFWTEASRREIRRARGQQAAEVEMLMEQLPEEFQPELGMLISDFADVFSEEPRPASTRSTEHRIILRDDIPIRVPPFRYSEEKKKAIAEACTEMLHQGVIRRSTSEYNPPVLLILDEEPDPRQGRNTLFERVLDGQEDDEECRADRQRLLHVQLNGPQNDNERRVAAQYFVENGKLWKRKSDVQRALVVPTQLRDLVLDEYHDSVLAAHPGRDETLTAIQRAYFWQDMQRDVGDYVQSCLVCASTKRGALQAKAPLRPRIPTQPGHTWSIDVLGPYPQTVRTKKEYILVAVDLFTKWVEAEAVLRATHVEVIAFVDSIAARFGYPAVIITDNGGVFRSAQWERYLQEKHVEAYFAPIYHQRANPVERRVQELKKVLRVNRVETHRWDQHLSEALFSLRTRKNAATGQTASELVYGENLKRPGEWTIPPEVVPPQERNQEIRRQRLQQARRRQEVYARNLFPEPREAGTEFAPGSQVLTRVWTKPADGNPFHATWTGPHQVITRHGNNTYTVERDGLQVRIHVDDLRPPPPARGNAAHPQE